MTAATGNEPSCEIVDALASVAKDGGANIMWHSGPMSLRTITPAR